MKVWIIIVFIVISIFASTEIQSLWRNSDNLFNNNILESQEIETQIRPNTVVSFSNNSKYLFITLKTYDENFARKITMFGLTTWINGNGRKQKNAGIIFPIEQKDPSVFREAIKNSEEKENSVCEIAKSFSNRVGMHFGDSAIKYMPTYFAKENGVNCVLGCENSLFFYWFAIPLSGFDEEIFPFRYKKNISELMIGLELGKSQMKPLHNMQKDFGFNQNGGRGGGRRSMGGGSKMGNARKTGGPGQHQGPPPDKSGMGKLSENDMKGANGVEAFSTWIKVKLANNE